MGGGRVQEQREPAAREPHRHRLHPGGLPCTVTVAALARVPARGWGGLPWRRAGSAGGRDQRWEGSGLPRCAHRSLAKRGGTVLPGLSARAHRRGAVTGHGSPEPDGKLQTASSRLIRGSGGPEGARGTRVTLPENADPGPRRPGSSLERGSGRLLRSQPRTPGQGLSALCRRPQCHPQAFRGQRRASVTRPLPHAP